MEAIKIGGRTVRKGRVSDIAWIASLLVEGAKAGHFKPTVATQAVKFLTSLLVTGSVGIIKQRYGRVWVEAANGQVWVRTQAGQAAAFLVVLEDEDGYELHLAATRASQRRRGHFASLVEHAIDAAPCGKRIFARCYKCSVLAMTFLKAKGFT